MEQRGTSRAQLRTCRGRISIFLVCIPVGVRGNVLIGEQGYGCKGGRTGEEGFGDEGEIVVASCGWFLPTS